jgi:hypothetical protein
VHSRKALWIAVLLSVLLVAAAVGQVPAERLFVGLVQENGVLVPFARYDGVRWVNTWPASVPRDEKNVPHSITQVPSAWIGGGRLPELWTLWLPIGTAHPIRVQRLTYSQTNCAEIWALMTDFPKALNTLDGSCPLRTIGVALSTSQTLFPMTPASGQALPTALMEASFLELERKEARSYPGSWDLTTRGKYPIRVERAWEVNLNSGEAVYYIEAVRRYSNKPVASDCANVAAFRGWIVRNQLQKERVLTSRVVLTDCDFKEAGFTTPIGVLELGERTFVVVQDSGWESQSYGILRLESNRMLRVIDAQVH